MAQTEVFKNYNFERILNANFIPSLVSQQQRALKPSSEMVTIHATQLPYLSGWSVHKVDIVNNESKKGGAVFPGSEMQTQADYPLPANNRNRYWSRRSSIHHIRPCGVRLPYMAVYKEWSNIAYRMCDQTFAQATAKYVAKQKHSCLHPCYSALRCITLKMLPRKVVKHALHGAMKALA